MSDVSITALTARARTWAASPLLTQAGICPLLEDLANTLEAAERDAQRAEDQANNLAGDVVQLEKQVAVLEAVTVPTEELAQQTHPFSQSPHMAAKYWAELVRARNRIAELEAVAVPVEPEWEYRRRHPRRANSPATFETVPELNHGEWVERRMLGEWEAVAPDEVTEGGTQ